MATSLPAQAGASAPPAEPPAKPAAASTLRTEGLVVDALGQPLPMADVWVAGVGPNREVRTKTDGQGMFVLARAPLDQGYVTVRATAPDKAEAWSFAGARDGVASAHLQLFDAAQLTGQVVDREGKGLAGAQVCATFDLARVSFRDVVATTDRDGKFTLDKVPLGVIDLRAVADGCACTSQQVHVTGQANAAAVRIELREAKGLPLAIETSGLTPEEAVTVSVRLLPYVDGSLLELPPRLTRGKLDAQGKWQVTGLPEAEYRVSLSAPKLNFAPRDLRLYSQHRGSRILGAPFEPTTEPIARFKAQRNQDVMLRGTLHDTEGKPIAGETIMVRASNGGAQSTTQTDEQGTFTVESPLAPGTKCVFLLRNSTWQLFNANLTDAQDRRDLLWHESQVDPSTVVALIARRPAVVVGRLVDSEGRPVSWTDVELQETRAGRMPEWMRWTSTRTAKDGSFRFQVTALPEPVRVSVEAAAGVGASIPIDVAWGAKHDLGTIQLQAAATIAGVVRDVQGEVVPGARVWLRDWDMATGQQRSGSVVETITDRAGRYRFVGVPTGGAWLQVTLHGETNAERAVAPFDVNAGDQLSFDLVVR